MDEGTLAARIQRRLDKVGKTREQVSVAIGRHRDYIRNIMRGRSKEPKGRNLAMLAAELQCTVEWLIKGAGRETLGRDGDEGELLKVFREMSPTQRAAYLSMGRAMIPVPDQKDAI